MKKILMAAVAATCLTAPASAQYFPPAPMPRPETQYYSPYSYQLQMDQYVQGQIRNAQPRYAPPPVYIAPVTPYPPNVTLPPRTGCVLLCD